MQTGVKIIIGIFAGLGVLGILLSTSFLTRWGEAQLVGVFYNIVIFGAGIFGAMLGSKSSTGKAIGLGIAFLFLMGGLLMVFFNVIWPML